MESWFILAVSLVYLASLFAIAWYSDRKGESPAEAPGDRRTPLLYALSLGVYCTSWTFYGAVGRAATGGFYFLPIYIGPIVMIGLGWPVLARIVRLAKAENVVSISDFLAARYGKSQGLAALVTATAVVGLLPYIALQMKAITISFEALAGGVSGAVPGVGAARLPGGTTLMVAFLMAAFAILFGVRSISANEHHRGLMTAIAAESVVKLAAALAVGGFVAVAVFGDPAGFLAAAAAHPAFLETVSLGSLGTDWWVACLLSALAMLCLPRQFHVAVVENTHAGDIRTAARLFPAYLIVINLFVLPVALAGLMLFPAGSNADTFMVSIPRQEGWPWLALVAFIGGLSAATSMILVEMVALSTMICNDIAVPLLMALRPHDRRLRENPAPVLLAVRRSAVIAVLVLAYGCYRLIGSAFPLATIGLMSFTAVAQFAPALLGGLVWTRATKAGAFGGICAGFLGWVYTMLLPSFADAGWVAAEALRAGPFGLSALSPVALAGLTGIDPLTNAVLWSLGPNLLVFVGLSLLTSPSPLEVRQAARFVQLRRGPEAEAHGPRGATLADLHDLAARYVGQAKADAVFQRLAAGREGTSAAIQATERLLAGAVGTASARVVVAGLLSDRHLSRTDVRSIIDDASRAILKQHELLRATVENISQGIGVFDEEFRVATWNRRFEVLLDLPDGFVQVGTTLEEIVRFNEQRGEYGRNGEIETLLARRSDPRRQGRPDVYLRERPDGTVLEIATNPMPGGGFVAVYTDVTEQHRAAAALREANEGLERKIAERTRALAAAKAEAERANQGKTRFLAAAGHDLMQPLHAARLFLAALGDPTDNATIGQVDTSLRSVEHILGDLLEVSKLDSGVMRPNPAPIRIGDLMEPLIQEFTVLAGQHGLTLRAVRSDAAVFSDPHLLRRILQNFLSNAVRYTARGRILFGCRRRGDALSIEVWDTGPGIPHDKQREIFVEFRQLDEGAADGATGRGLGLGLAIVERLAGILGHGIAVRSEVGRGSGFSVLVPLAAEAPAERPAPAPRSRRSFDGALVLCVENEPAIAQAMDTLLTGWSCRVVTAPTAEQALAALEGQVPDLILSDYHLGRGRTGLEALESLHAAFGRPVPAALITADRGAGLRDSAKAAGIPLLHKPVRPGALRALVNQLLMQGRSVAQKLPAQPAER
ncbi:PAS domain-containing hybrid sensor histidine kinase/response regulator [Azospirillum canadense]|uniref:PAS domain-containing hybrid sensor histidine kinase/response regulator n=1 Tax=Azospirillum canadense TaxID=403962 RepID=UPI002226BE12|nr:PAS domain-containing hybrid sensor histidine kinase/response regulator [Azospirillum canadense]MCW2238832.1 Na+/proline symporter/signal transduction histidine kinase/CheY-like chemotaxis protein [Azospirillum canadense]